MGNLKIINLLIQYQTKTGELITLPLEEETIERAYKDYPGKVTLICNYENDNKEQTYKEEFYIGRKVSIEFAKKDPNLNYLFAGDALDKIEKLEREGYEYFVEDNNFNPLFGIKKDDKTPVLNRENIGLTLLEIYKKANYIQKYLTPQIEVKCFTNKEVIDWFYDNFAFHGIDNISKIEVLTTMPTLPVNLQSESIHKVYTLYLGEIVSITDLLPNITDPIKYQLLTNYQEKYTEVIILKDGTIIPKKEDDRAYKSREELNIALTEYKELFESFQTDFKKDPYSTFLPFLPSNGDKKRLKK